MTAILSSIATAWAWFKTFALVGIAMSFVQPATNHAELAMKTTMGIFARPPLVEDPKLEVAIVVAREVEESSLREDAIGDSGRSLGVMQIYGARRMSTVENVAAGIEQLRISFALCKQHPFADYVAGPSGCTSPRAIRLSNHGERLVARILGELTSTEGIAQR